ncbi:MULTISPECIES: hypothetical protein [Bacteria]|uniref:hypothetical protein n=1 Tax=Bacteria TaxID=2 RepID=UPI0025C0F07F|nr:MULTISPECIES: hypothetical protein [Bacteria]
MSKTRLAVLGLAALLIAGCGPVHPGAAAVVDGTRIPMSDVDDVAAVYCAASQSDGSAGAQAGIDSVGLRRQAMADLLAGEVADQIARERDYDIQVPAVPEADRAQLAEMFGDGLDDALRLIDRNQRTSAIVAEMAREQNPQVQDEEQLLQAGQQLLSQAVADVDISVDPRFGLDQTLQQVAQTGSLSVAAIDLEATAVEDRPAALQCTA